MTYLITTSKVATAISHHATGFFTESSDRFVVLNRGNVLSLFRICESASLEEALTHVQDFRLFCSLKYVHSVAIINPITKKIERHILFLSSVKHEVCLVTLGQDTENEGRYVMETLYSGKVPGAYQKSLHLIHTVSCSTDLSPTPVIFPFVAMTSGAGDLHFIDILAALGSQITEKKFAGGKTLSPSVLSPTTVEWIKKRASLHPYLKIPFHISEFDVKSMSFGSVSEDGSFIPLYILSGDRAGSMHISEYCLSLTETVSKAADPSTSASFFSLIRSDQVIRKRCVQNNVDPTGRCILSSPNGVVCVGSQLITFLSLQTGCHSLTIEMPFEDHLGAEEIEAALLPCTPGNDFVICTVAKRCVTVLFEHHGGPLSRASVVMSTDNVGTLPSSILPLSFNTCLFCSHLQDTILVELESWKRWAVLENCGPVLDIAIGTDDSSVVLASTGAEAHGGVTVLRCIVSLNSEARIPLQHNANVSGVIAVGEIIILKACETFFVQFFHPNHSVHEVVLSDLSVSILSCGDLMNVYCHNHEYVFVFENNIVLFFWNDDSKTILKASKVFCANQEQDGGFVFSSFYNGDLVISSSHSLFFLSWDLECQWSIPSPSSISAIAVHSGICAVGTWDSSALLIDLSTQCIVGVMDLDAVPRSICCVLMPKSSQLTFLIGLTNGYLCVTTTDFFIEGRFQQYFLLASHPLHLSLLNDVTVISFATFPILLVGSREGFFIKGFGVDGVSSCGTLWCGDKTKYIFFSKTGNSLHIGELEKAESKMSGTFLPLGGTVRILRIISSWDGFVVAIRRKNQESILFLTNSCISGNTVQPLVEDYCELLENEQCIFLEPISLEFPGEVWKKTVLLAGTSFVFREVQTARASRIMWFPRGSKGELNPMGEKDIKGSLYSCCVVPQSSGKVVLGVSGAVVLYRWSVQEMTFINCEVLEVGLMVFRLLPAANITVSANASNSSSTVVAFDCRFGAIYIEVNTRKGVMSVVCRESQIREATAGVVLAREAALIADQNDNILILQQVKERQEAPSDASERTDTPIEKYSIKVQGEFHVGQCINCLERGSCGLVDLLAAKSNHLSLPQSDSVIFGTAHGAFGTITPVDFPSYFVLRAMEYAIMQIEFPVGLFLPEYFQRSPAHGNFGDSGGGGHENGVIPIREPGFSRRCVVDGDVIKSFLFLSKKKREEVLNVATQTATSWWPSFHKVHKDCGGNTDFSLPSSGSSFDGNFEYMQEKCNEILFAARLPLLPFTEDKVLQFIFFIQQLS